MAEAEDNTFIDGLGVVKHQPLGVNTRILFRIAESGQKDISAYVENGKLHIYGVNQMVIVSFKEPNHIEVHTALSEERDARS